MALAEDLSATSVAEGIEEPADLQVAHDLRIQAAQGYLFARPSTDREDLRAWLTRHFTLPCAPADRVLPPAPWRLAAPGRSGVAPRPGVVPGSSP